MAAGDRYVPIDETEMRELMTRIGFETIALPRTTELVFQRQIETSAGKKFPYAVRVYSSVAHGNSRGVGEDAIRVVLIDLDEENPKFQFMKVIGEGTKKAGRRIYRTKSAMATLEARCREYFTHVIKNPCPKCGSVMAVRNSKNGQFLGCTKFRTGCRGTREIES